MKYCPNCGNPVKEDWKVCANCGKKLAWAMTPEDSVNGPRHDAKKKKGSGGKKKILMLLAIVVMIFAGLAVLLTGGLIVLSGSNQAKNLAENPDAGDTVTPLEGSLNREDAGINEPVGEVESSIKQTTTSSTTTKASSTTSTSIKETAGSDPASSTSTSTSTTLDAGTPESVKTLVESCVNKYNISSDTIIYVYTDQCCRFTVTPIVHKLEQIKGYKFEFVTADELDDLEEKILKCYLPPGDIMVPQLICPANGDRRVITSRKTLDQVMDFCEECEEAAYG